MKIIGHRGAAGLALENSRSALRAAIKHGVDAVEFDVRLTADGRLVVIHDAGTGRVADVSQTVRRQTLAELRKLNLNNGEGILTLDEALDIIGHTPAIIELKDKHSVAELLLALTRHPHANPGIASFQHDELRQIKQTLPDVPTYALERLAPVDIINTARNLHATGIGLNKWIMNPLTYWLARHYRLEIYLYTVNSPLLARCLHLLYPNVLLCTNHPERFAGR